MNPVLINTAPKLTFSEAEIELSRQLYIRGSEFARKGIHQNLPEARLLFLQSAEKGNALAMDRLGFMYQYGLGGPMDLNGALAMYNKAVLLGYTESYLNIYCLNLLVEEVFGPHIFKKE